MHRSRLPLLTLASVVLGCPAEALVELTDAVQVDAAMPPDDGGAADTQDLTAPPPEDTVTPQDLPAIEPDPGPTTDVPDAVDEAPAPPPPSPCPPAMALVGGGVGVCVDPFEAALEEETSPGVWAPASPFLTVGDRVVRAVPADGLVPQGYVSGKQAKEACLNAGKRLCSSDEWLQACRGPENHTWPYGAEHVPGACNDDYAGGHPVVDFFGTSEGIWDAAHMNDPGINQQAGTLAAGGDYAACVSHWGVYDLHGNLHEWVSDSSGVFRGGFYADAAINGAGCAYVTTAHATGYHDYSTGFRCCTDADPAEQPD